MKGPWPGAVFLALLLSATAAVAQSSPPVPAKASPDEALAWDRDFDLLLEVKNVPTKGQAATDARRNELEQEHADLADHLAALRARLAAIEGTYTSEALFNEMLRQGVGDMRTARDNLQAWIARDEARSREIEEEFKKLPAGSVQ